MVDQAGDRVVSVADDVRANNDVAIGGALSLLDRIADKLDQIYRVLGEETGHDVTYVVAGTPAGAAVYSVPIPALRHVEITLVSFASVATHIAVFAGNLSLAQAQQRHGVGTGAQSTAIVATGDTGGTVVAREYLDASGYLTVYVSTACTFDANVRVKNLEPPYTKSGAYRRHDA